MPTKPIHLILLLTILLAGCAPAAAADTPTPLPSRTPAPPSPTPSKTSFWRIVTSSPSNLSPTITMPPPHLQDNSCPATDESYQHPFPETISSANELIDPVLEALNNGITLAHLHESLKLVGSAGLECAFEDFEDEDGNITTIWEPCKTINNPISMRDLTGDGVNEVVFTASAGGMVMPYRLQVYTCQSGKYTKMFFHEYHYDTSLDFLDLNGNNIPEIIFHDFGEALSGPALLYIYEWDGENFRNLILPHEDYYDTDFPGAYATRGSCFSDYIWKADGTYEILMSGFYWGFGEYNTNGPYRDYTYKFVWNGTHFQTTEEEPDPPEYRFQAVQDGDWETWRGNFEEALAFYNKALHDPSLKSLHNQACRPQHRMLYAADANIPTPTPCPPDPNEQAMLTTYIHYRKMLIYAAQGKTTQARNEYLVLNQLASWHPAYPFKGLANVFWKEYQATQDLGTACSKTRENVYDNYDVFVDSIGMSWHVWRGGPTDELICPFEKEVIEPTATPEP